MRYLKINSEFIYDYYRTKFNITDLKNIFNSFEKIELPISKNNCLTILKMYNFNEKDFFLNNFYENLRRQNKKYDVKIGNEKYDVCIDSRTYKIFEQSILNYINLKTKDDFKKFVYEQQKKIRKYVFLGDTDSINIEIIVKSHSFLKEKYSI